MPLHLQTPLIYSHPLSIAAGRPVCLKLEALQPPGSFKIRGIGLACEHHASRGAERFISSSGGNAGLAVAHAGRILGIPVTVVIPETTPLRAQELLGMEGAEVVVHGASWQEANEHAQSLIGEKDAFLHPFDDPLLWEGHATLIDEMVDAGLRPDAVVLSVGGGGLFSGVAQGLERNGLGGIPIVAGETEGAASFHGAINAGQPVTLDRITSIATSLGAKRVCDESMRWVGRRSVRSALVTDQSALAACERFLDDHRLLVEPACGVALALAYERAEVLDPFETIVIVVCGGATATIDQIRKWRT